MTSHTATVDVFPLSIAEGEAFCNRELEIKKIKYCIENHRPVLIVSPRRYGKTSLALHTIQKTKLPFAHIDFFSAIDEQDIERAILKGIQKLLSGMESLPKRVIALATELFEGASFRASFGKMEFSFKTPERKEKPAYRVLDILERLESLAKKTNQKMVLFFDEFQQLAESTSTQAMESVLRQVAQLTKSISFIFSGSNRHLLHELFDDRNRPFYKLCERVTLDRISEEAYTKHIQKAALKTWKTELPERIMESLFTYSERHPYYLNLLCARLSMKKTLPTPDLIDNIWRQYVMEERSSVAAELELLSKNQRKLLTALSRTNGTNAPLGQVFIQKANMSKTTVDQALTFLEKKDYVFKDHKGEIQVLDPLIKSVLCE